MLSSFVRQCFQTVHSRTIFTSILLYSSCWFRCWEDGRIRGWRHRVKRCRSPGVEMWGLRWLRSWFVCLHVSVMAMMFLKEYSGFAGRLMSTIKAILSKDSRLLRVLSKNGGLTRLTEDSWLPALAVNCWLPALSVDSWLPH